MLRQTHPASALAGKAERCRHTGSDWRLRSLHYGPHPIRRSSSRSSSKLDVRAAGRCDAPRQPFLHPLLLSDRQSICAQAREMQIWRLPYPTWMLHAGQARYPDLPSDLSALLFSHRSLYRTLTGPLFVTTIGPSAKRILTDRRGATPDTVKHDDQLSR